MAERTLLERLRDPRPGADRQAKDDVQAIADSVQRNLQRMLNSRWEHARTVPEFGIPDLTEALRSFPESTTALEESIRQSIEKFEPRVRDVSVRFVESEDDVLLLSFEVNGQLVTRDEQVGIWFMTKIDANGRVDVRG